MGSKFETNGIYTVQDLANLFEVDKTAIERLIFSRRLSAKQVSPDKWLIHGSYLEDFFAKPDNDEKMEVIDIDYLKKQIKAKIGKLKSGKKFSIKDLLDEWDANIAFGDKIKLGKWFKDAVVNDDITEVKIGRKTSSNTQIYIKK